MQFVFAQCHLFSCSPFSSTDLPFQLTSIMSSGSGAADPRAGRPPGAVVDTSRFRRDAEAAATEAPDAEQVQGGAQSGVVMIDGRGALAGIATRDRGSKHALLAEALSDCNKNTSANAASAKVRHSLTFLVLFCPCFYMRSERGKYGPCFAKCAEKRTRKLHF